MRSLIVAALATLVLGLVGAQTAGAAAHFYSDVSGGSFVAHERGSSHYNWAGGTFACATVSYDGVKPASGTATSFPFNFHPGSCSTRIAGVTHAVTPPWCTGPWRATLVNAFPAAPASGMYANWTTCSAFTFTIDDLGCSVTFAATTVTDGIYLQDRNATDTVNAVPSAASGMRILWGGSLGYTTTCSGYAASGTGTLDAIGFFPGIWVGA